MNVVRGRGVNCFFFEVVMLMIVTMCESKTYERCTSLCIGVTLDDERHLPMRFSQNHVPEAQLGCRPKRISHLSERHWPASCFMARILADCKRKFGYERSAFRTSLSIVLRSLNELSIWSYLTPAKVFMMASTITRESSTGTAIPICFRTLSLLPRNSK